MLDPHCTLQCAAMAPQNDASDTRRANILWFRSPQEPGFKTWLTEQENHPKPVDISREISASSSEQHDHEPVPYLVLVHFQLIFVSRSAHFSSAAAKKGVFLEKKDDKR